MRANTQQWKRLRQHAAMLHADRYNKQQVEKKKKENTSAKGRNRGTGYSRSYSTEHPRVTSWKQQKKFTKNGAVWSPTRLDYVIMQQKDQILITECSVLCSGNRILYGVSLTYSGELVIRHYYAKFRVQAKFHISKQKHITVRICHRRTHITLGVKFIAAARGSRHFQSMCIEYAIAMENLHST